MLTALSVPRYLDREGLCSAVARAPVARVCHHHPLPTKKGTTRRVLKAGTCKPSPESGLDCLACAMTALYIPRLPYICHLDCFTCTTLTTLYVPRYLDREGFRSAVARALVARVCETYPGTTLHPTPSTPYTLLSAPYTLHTSPNTLLTPTRITCETGVIPG